MQTGAESSSLFCSIVYPAKNLSNSYMIAVRVVGLSSAVEQTDGAERNRKGSCPNPFWKYYWYGCRHCVRSLYLEKIAFSRDNLVPLFSHPSTSLCFIHKPLHPPHAPSYHPPPPLSLHSSQGWDAHSLFRLAFLQYFLWMIWSLDSKYCKFMVKYHKYCFIQGGS